MSEFLKQYEVYQDSSINLSDADKIKIEELIQRFAISDIDDFLLSIDKYDLRKDSVKINNFLTIINNESFIIKITDVEKQKITDKIETTLLKDIQKLNEHKLLRYWLHALL